MRASPRRIFINPPSSRTPAEGHSRFSIWTLNLVFQISICFLPFILFFLILQLGATLTTDDIAHPRGVKCGQCRWLGGRRLVSLFAALCISGGGVWTARLAGTEELGLVYWSQKTMQILPLTKSHSACCVQMGNLQTNSSWSWMRHWQSLNTLQTIQLWVQLTAPGNEFYRWESRARQTTWRPLTTTESLLCFYADTSKMRWLAPHTEWNVPTMRAFIRLCKCCIASHVAASPDLLAD